ncbi:TetR/AcrR family transcriptional regulator C-terminal ligand-binding domain-containing protein [Kitasatospora sp. NPDC058218]|uniref:TetR/AcrR family transcriptional regulator C-terminal ligand-binding domain-containing protein n=1 Tax=Kitasatospora sp. NPDC058218 TaxID=3346385 RepID=UPI0036D98CB6
MPDVAGASMPERPGRVGSVTAARPSGRSTSGATSAPGRLSPDGCRIVITRAAERAGLPVRLTGHSQRAGLITTSIKAGKRPDNVRAQSGHAAGYPSTAAPAGAGRTSSTRWLSSRRSADPGTCGEGARTPPVDPALLREYHERLMDPLLEVTRDRLCTTRAADRIADDADLAVELLYGPMYYRLLHGLGPLDHAYADRIVGGGPARAQGLTPDRLECPAGSLPNTAAW